jgi:hypothetical protein
MTFHDWVRNELLRATVGGGSAQPPLVVIGEGPLKAAGNPLPAAIPSAPPFTFHFVLRKILYAVPTRSAFDGRRPHTGSVRYPLPHGWRPQP